MYTYEQKKEIYERFIRNGRIWFALDKSLEPTWEERQVILEMKQVENEKVKRDLDIEKRAKRIRDNELKQRVKDVRERYGNKGLLSDKIFDALDNY